jgi:hypothetical protein
MLARCFRIALSETFRRLIIGNASAPPHHQRCAIIALDQTSGRASALETIDVVPYHPPNASSPLRPAWPCSSLCLRMKVGMYFIRSYRESKRRIFRMIALYRACCYNKTQGGYVSACC